MKLLSDRHEILEDMVEDKNQVAEQSNGKVLRANFEEMKELEENIKRGSATCAEKARSVEISE